MNASFHVLEEILQGFNGDAGGRLLQKFSTRYSKDLELNRINRLHQQYLKEGSPEKMESVKKRLEALQASRKFESSGANELPLTDRRKSNSRSFYQHEEK